MTDRFANVAKLVGDPTRAAILLKLMSGRALPASELAAAANVTPQTASEHLSRLREGGLVAVHQQGRHRYYRLSRVEVGAAVESLMVLSLAPNEAIEPAKPPEPGTLAHARTCYSHLAGWLGVAIADSLQRKELILASENQSFVVTEQGVDWLKKMGLNLPIVPELPDRSIARQCIDWTERRPHLAGKLGVAVYKRLLDLRWITPCPGHRVLRVTVEGREALTRELGIPL